LVRASVFFLLFLFQKDVGPATGIDSSEASVSDSKLNIKRKANDELGSDLTLEYDKKKGKYVCDVCWEPFASVAALVDHADKSHDEEIHVCRECGAIFDRDYELRHHKKDNHRNVRWPTGETKRDLLRHDASVQRVIKVLKCEDCGKTYRTKDALLGHAYKVHGKTLPGLKMLSCPVCGTLFHLKASFKNHVKIHVKKTNPK
jgi:uncharacterized C2H2 Zn-finger protein